MDFIKSWFIDPENKTGCRFVVVDSYNEEIPLAYYQRNDFEFLFSSEEQEKEYMGLPEDYELKTGFLNWYCFSYRFKIENPARRPFFN